MFGFGKGRIEEIDQAKQGEIIGRVEIKRIDRSTRDIKAILVDCITSKTLYKATYTTKARTDFYAFEEASEDLKRVIDREDYILRGEITTNSTDIPFIQNVSKGSRW